MKYILVNEAMNNREVEQMLTFSKSRNTIIFKTLCTIVSDPSPSQFICVSRNYLEKCICVKYWERAAKDRQQATGFCST